MFALPWHNDIVIEFIERYKNEQLLWDPKHPDNKNKVAVLTAWERIADEMSIGCSVVDLKKKKESLMTSYRVHSRRKRLDQNYTTNWFAFTHLDSFLGEIYRNHNNNNEDISQELLHQSNLSNFTELGQPIKQEKEESVPRKRTKKQSSDTFEYSPSYSYNTLEREPDNGTDECELYSQLLAKKMRKLDEYQRDIVMHEIDNIMFRAKLRSDSSRKRNIILTRESPSPVFIEGEQHEEYETDICMEYEYLEDPMPNI